MQFSTLGFVSNYQLLSSPSPSTQSSANRYILELTASDQVWMISKQLLCSTDQTQQFLGSQLLYQKVQDSFGEFGTEHRQELKNFCYNLMFSLKEGSTATRNKLALTCAVIACWMVKEEWLDFVQEIMGVMGKDQTHFVIGLGVLEEIPDECKGMKGKSFSEKMEVKDRFLLKENLLTEIFSTGFKINDDKVHLKNLKCLRNWAKFGFRCLNYPLLSSEIVNQASTEERMEMVQSIFSDCLRQQYYNFNLSVAEALTTRTRILPEAIQSIEAIVTFLLKPSPFHLPFSYLTKSLIIYYPWVLLQSLSISQKILDKMLSLLSHQSLDISYSSLLFWTCLFEIGSQIQSSSDFTQLLTLYTKSVIDSILAKVKLSSVEDIDFETNAEEQLDLEHDPNIEYMVGVTFEEYRLETSKFFLYLQQFLSLTPHEDHLITVISVHLSSASPCDTELGIYILRSIVELLKPSPVLSQMVHYITSLNSPNAKIKMESFRLLMVLGETVLDIAEMFNFVISYLEDEAMVDYVVNVFCGMAERMKQHETGGLLERVRGLLEKGVEKVGNLQMEKVVEAGIKVIVKMTDIQAVESYLQRVLESSLVRTLNKLQLSSPYLREITEVVGYLSGFEFLRTQKPGLFDKFSVSYCNALTPIVTRIIHQAKDKMVYSSLNELGVSLEVYLKCIKLIGPNLSVSTSLLNTTCEGITLNPQHNIELLQIVSETILFHDIRNNQLAAWLQSSYEGLNNFLVHAISTSQDPDVIRVYFGLKSNFLISNKGDLTSAATLGLAFWCLQNIVESGMDISILSYIDVYLEYYHQQEGRILKMVFSKLSTASGLVATIMVKILCDKEEDVIREIVEELVRSEYRYDELEVQLLLRALSFYIQQRDFNGLNMAFMDILLGDDLKPLTQRFELSRQRLKQKK